MNPFAGRSIQVVRDLTIDEQVYLYETARRIKAAHGKATGLEQFRINDPDLGVYLLFLEDSTRTKESFRNAAKFHAVRVNDFSAAGSSIKKKESITDTVKMLVGYNSRSIFIVRSRIEGVCRWLERELGFYANRHGLPVPSFINAGDGRHEHPTQEFLDEFSFLEQTNWDRSSIHLALVGDLFHGRTVHSKVDGLQIYDKVRVDLVAPAELAMPPHYIEQMVSHGFELRFFSSIEEYLGQDSKAPIWYFTRLQLERMGERLLQKADFLRSAVTFRREFSSQVPEGTRFFHPLPRHSVTPVIPSFLDRTSLNGWDEQSMNGYFTRIAQIGLLSGFLGHDFSGRPTVAPDLPDDFVEEAQIKQREKPDYKIGIKPVTSGIVIDHIGKGRPVPEIWNHINKIRSILNLNVISSHGVFPSGEDRESCKGLISIPDIEPLDERTIKMLGAIAPGCTVNVISEGRVEHKYRLRMPRRVYDFEEIGCRNETCVSHPQNHENVIPEFRRKGDTTFVCLYCERPHDFQDIWLAGKDSWLPASQEAVIDGSVPPNVSPGHSAAGDPKYSPEQ